MRERREHARGRNLADCGSIYGCPCISVGSIKEMWKKYSKGLTIWIVTVEKLNSPHCGNYNVGFPLGGKNCLKFFTNLEV